MSVAHESMTPEVATACIFSFVYQLSKSQDRRTLMDPSAAAAHRRGQAASARRHEQTLLESVISRAEKSFSARKREEALRDGGLDALDELDASKDLKGVTNHATGLPESVTDLGHGREVIRGEDLAMSAAIPCWGLATAVSQTNETSDGSWQAMGYKPSKTHCAPCKSLGRLEGPICTDCHGKGVRKSSLLLVFKRREFSCTTCGGHGRVKGPLCEPCGGNGTIQNWSAEEHETVRVNARAIAKQVAVLAKEGYFIPSPLVAAGDEEMDNLIWEDGTGNVTLFRVTHKGYAEMQRFMGDHPELRRMVPLLEYAGADVRAQAPQWAQDEYEEQRQ